jgi:hypothetical protein
LLPAAPLGSPPSALRPQGRAFTADAMVLLLARNSVVQARPGLVARVLGAKRN